MRKRSIGILILFLFLGAIIGSALGEVIALILPDGVVKEFFTRSVMIGFGLEEEDKGDANLLKIHLGFINFAFGFNFKLNVIGVVGIAFAAYLLRWYHQRY